MSAGVNTRAGRAMDYRARLVWEGNRGEGTAQYQAYGREYRLQVEGKPDLVGSADPAFRGDADRYNPEDMFLGALAACHMLFYLALCARKGLRIAAYEDRPLGSLVLEPDGSGRFALIVLRPRVTLENPAQMPDARALHAVAHQRCFLSNSCRVPIRVEPAFSGAGE